MLRFTYFCFVIVFLLTGCEEDKNILMNGDEVNFIFIKITKSLVDITFQETEGDLVKSANRESSWDCNYYIETKQTA